MRNQQGFTLTEMIVVLLLLSILCSMAAPSLLDCWHQVQLDWTIQQLHRDLRWAQREAAREQRKVNVTFFLQKEPYTYTVRFAGATENLRRRELPKGMDKVYFTTITVDKNKRFHKNGHIMIQKGRHERYVYFYQTGRTRVTREATA